MLHAIGSLIAFMLMLPSLFQMLDLGNASVQQRLAADHLRIVTRAARNYINRHQDTLLSQSTAASGPAVSIQTMINEGFLHEGFSALNVWQQEYTIHVRQPENGQLQAIVLTSGGRGASGTADKFANVFVPAAAALAGGAGGFVPTGVMPGQSEDMLQGSGGGWAINLTSLGIASPGAGHLGALSIYDSTALGQDYLYRVAVPGNPELNAMQVALDMTDNAVNNVESLQFTEREITTESCTAAEDQGRIFLDRIQGLYLCRNNSLEIIGDSGNSVPLKSVTVAKNGDQVTKPVCAPGTGTAPAVFTAPSIAEAGPEAPPLTSFQTWATSLSDTEWQVHMRVQTGNKRLDGSDDEGWVYPADDYGRIMVLVMCVKQPETPTP